MAVMRRYAGSSYDAADGSQKDIPPVLFEYQHALYNGMMSALCFESVNKFQGNIMCECVLEGGVLCILLVFSVLKCEC
jgi:hypothetical protein